MIDLAQIQNIIGNSELQQNRSFYFYNDLFEIRILHPAYHQITDKSDKQIVDFLAETGAIDLTKWTYIDSAIPEYDTRWERNSYKFSKTSNTIYPDLSLVREEVKARLRIERAPLLTKLDIEFQRALELGVDFSHIVEEKTRLRSITSAVDTMEDFDELYNFHC